MSIFRKQNHQIRPTRYSAASDNLVSREVPISSENAQVTITTKISSKDALKTIAMPCTEDYNLENLLKAGVPLKEVSVGHLLDSSDPQSSQLVDAMFNLETAVKDGDNK